MLVLKLPAIIRNKYYIKNIINKISFIIVTFS
jgi:hypothetical protein